MSDARRLWQTWTTHLQSQLGQHAHAPSVQRAAQSFPDAAPTHPVGWTKALFGSARGTFATDPLTFLACAGDCSYFDPEVAAIIQQTGMSLIRTFDIKTHPDLFKSILNTSWRERSLDTLERLAMASSWGADARHQSQEILALYARHAGWHSHEAEDGKCLEILIQHGILESPMETASCPISEHPLICALQDRNWKLAADLNDLGIRSDWICPESGATLWHLAAVAGPSMGKKLLPKLSNQAARLAGLPARAGADFGLDAFSVDSDSSPWRIPAGCAPLHLAAKELDGRAAQAILDAGAPASPINLDGDTPLHMLAKRHGSKAESSAAELVELLLSRGADPGIANRAGLTPAQALAAKAPLSAIAALLAARPQDVGDSTKASQHAFKSLSERGREAASLAEQAAFTTDFAMPAENAKTRTKSL